MQELALEQADPELVKLLDQVERSGEALLLTRNGREVARVERARERPVGANLPGDEIARRFEALRGRVRDHWPDQPEFDWKEAIESGRR